MIKRSIGIFKPNAKYALITSLIYEVTPTFFAQFKSNPNRKKAMNSEYNALVGVSIWKLIKLVPNMTIIG